MKTGLVLLFNMVLASAFFTPDISSCREMMDQAVDHKASAFKFYKELNGTEVDSDPVIVGFRAMSEFLMCKHLLNPFSRLSHFNKGKSLLENALKRDKGNPELLLFRLSTQTNVPALLNYNSDIEADKNALIGFLIKYKDSNNKGSGASDIILYKRIKTYLLMNKYCSASDKVRIKML